VSYFQMELDNTALSVPVFEKNITRSPKSLLLPELVNKHCHDTHLSTKGTVPAVRLYAIVDGKVGPHGAIITPDNKILASADVTGSEHVLNFMRQKLDSKDPADPFIRAVTGTARVLNGDDEYCYFVLNRPGVTVYGHWLIDILPMFYIFFHKMNGREILGDFLGISRKKLRFLLPNGTPKWALQILDVLFSISEDEILYYQQSTTIFQARTLVFASQMRFNSQFSSDLDGYVDFIQNRVSNFVSNDNFPNRIFVTRKGVNSNIPRQVHNEEALINIAIRNNLSIIDPTTLSWPDQVELFTKAKLVCGPFGSGLHNTIFSGSDAICFSLGSSRMNWCQSGLAGLRQQEMAYLLPAYEDLRDKKNVMVFDTERFDYALKALVST
jgi:hypothetical protein